MDINGSFHPDLPIEVHLSRGKVGKNYMFLYELTANPQMAMIMPTRK